MVDLKALPACSVAEAESGRQCPNCRTGLETLKVAAVVPCNIGHCRSCDGLFLGRGVLEALLEEVVKNVFDVDRDLLAALQNGLYRREKVVYRQCPACGKFMQRHNFGYRSGVVVDRCRPHGTWLDSGEFLHLAQWKKAGGQLLQERQEPSR